MPVGGEVMIASEADFNSTALDAQAQTAAKSSGLYASSMKLLVRRGRKKFLKRLTVIPKQPDHPFIWSHDPVKQARARGYWFAVKVPKGSTGGRYPRTGKLAEAWDIQTTITVAGGVLTAVNEARGSEYVYGPKQNPSHSLWPNKDKVGAQVGEELSEAAVELWHTITGARAGVR